MVVAGLTRLVAVFMMIVALAVAGHFVATPIYDPDLGETARTVWDILNYCMIAAGAFAVIAGFTRLRLMHTRTDTKEFVAGNVTFYASAGLLLLLLWNWADLQWGNGGDGQMWVVIDVGLPLVLGSSAVYLYREA